MKFVVFSSARGTSLKATLDAIAGGELHAECLGLVADRDDRECIQKAKDAGLPYHVVEKREGESREEYDQRLHEGIFVLGEPDILVAMGWLWILTPQFIAKWKNRILNVHPALLPNYGGEGMFGMHVHRAVLAAGETESGMTIHLMDEGVDTGNILLQKACSIDPEETPETLKAKVQALEKEWYPKLLEMIEKREIAL